MKSQKQDYDWIIQGATVMDGVGDKSFIADVAIQNGLIAAIGPMEKQKTRNKIAAKGLVLTPGFIDVHSHSDFNAFIYPKAHNKISQGVTTEIVGNCGMSAAPFQGKFEKCAATVWAREGVKIPKKIPWKTLSEYFDAHDEVKPQSHISALIGHGNLRFAVMGSEPREASEREIEAMEKILEACLREGAAGISFGLVYLPGVYANTEELIQLCRVVARYDGVCAFHIRNEGHHLIEAIEEAIQAAEKSRARVQISHLKAAGKKNWKKIAQAFRLIEKAQRQGLRIFADAYPYTASYAELGVILPREYFEREDRVDFFRNLANRQAVFQRLEKHFRDSPRDWANIVIASVSNPNQQACEGKTMAELCKESGKQPEAVLIEILARNDFEVSAFSFTQSPGVVRQVLSKPYVFAGSDSIADGSRHPHPRCYATFPRWIKSSGKRALAQAVRRMTALPAAHFGLKNRGQIRKGFAADLVLWDPKKIKDRATYENPKVTEGQGIAWVFLEGEAVVRKGVYSGARKGRMLRRQTMAAKKKPGIAAALAISVLLFFLAVPLYAQDFSVGQQFFQQGVRFRSEGNYAESERQLLKALEQEPDNADYHFELANTYAAFYDAWKKSDKERAKGMLDHAAHQFEQAAMFRPDFTAAHFNLGVIYKNKGEYEQARDKFRNVLALDSSSTAAWMQIGAIYEAQGFFDEAGDAYKKAKEIDPFNSNIQSAIEDLENTEVQYRDKRRQSEMAERLNLMNRNFRYNAFSPAGDYEKDRTLAQQGMGSAIPYLASMLADEFMKWQERRRENSGEE